jgi:hypothetical protein
VEQPQIIYLRLFEPSTGRRPLAIQRLNVMMVS